MKKTLFFLACLVGFTSLAQQDIDVIIRNSPISSGNNFELGTVMIDYPSTNTFIVENSGDATLTFDANVVLSGANDADFKIGDGDIFSGTSIEPGENNTFSLSFDPITSGAKSATITISSNDPDEGTFTFTLSGTAVDKPANCLVPTMDMESFSNNSVPQLNFTTFQVDGTANFEPPSGWTPLLSLVNAIFGNEVYVSETSDSRTGSSALLLTSANDGLGDVFTLIPCGDYPTKFSGYYKLSGVGGSATIIASTGGAVEENRSDSNTSTLEITSEASTFTLFELDLKYDANSVDTLFLYLAASSGASTSFVLDDLFITPGSGMPGVPFAPNPVVFSNQTTNSVTVNWSEPNDFGAAITSYTLEQKEGVSGSFSEVYSGSDLTYNATGLTAGETYFFRVSATNSVGDSEFSEEASFVPSSNIIMQNGNVTSCNASFFDSGGASGNYANDEDFTLTILPDTPGDKVSLSFTSFDVEDGFDFLDVYDGPDTNAPLIIRLTGSSLPSDITATGTGGELTFHFTSDGLFSGGGWEASISCSTPPENIIMSDNVVSACDALFFDSGGADGSYTDNEDFTLTIQPEIVGGVVSVSFSSFDVEEDFDFLDVYDGPDTNAPLIISLTGSSLPSDITATGTGGELTFHFTSDVSFSGGGWEAMVSCISGSTTTWNGTTWDNGDPNADTYAIIDGEYTGTGFTCSNLDINTDQALIITAGALDVKGRVSNEGTLDIASGASLLTYEGYEWLGNNVTIRRNTRYEDGRYSFVGSPVIQEASITGSDLGTFVYSYDETIPYDVDGINRWINASSDELIPGKGFTQANQLAMVFEGVPSNGTVVYSGTYTEDTNDANEGWNLVANPYSAAINTAEFLTTNSNTTGAIYIWDDNGSDVQRGTNADYITANGTMATNTTPAGGETRYNLHLGSIQGFFVQLNGAANTDITFDEGMRVADNNADVNFFRKTELPIARINLTDKGDLFRQTVIGIADDAKEHELNKTYDAQAFNASADFGLFTIKAGRSLALNGMNQGWESIQLQVNIIEAGTYSISAELENYDQPLYLKDMLYEKLVDLREESYSFYTEDGIITDRFKLLSSTSPILGFEQENVLVYAFNKTLYIVQESMENREYQLFDLNGRKILSTSVSSKAEINLSALNAGIYLVFDGHNTHKIILNK